MSGERTPARKTRDFMSKTGKCIIWGTPADYIDTNFDGYDIYSPRAGGRYEITRTAAVTFQNNYQNSIEIKLSLSITIYESQTSPDPIRITAAMLEEYATRAAVKPLDKAERLLTHMARRSPVLHISALTWGPRANPDDLELALAASGCAYDGELNAVLEYLGRRGFCETKIDNAKGEGWVWLTLEGAQHVAEATAIPGVSDRAFVAMWFSKEMHEAYELGIKQAITQHGFQSIRIDQQEHKNKIDDEIISEIRKSRFIVADFTCGRVTDGEKFTAIARGGVYFEAGFPLGLGIPVIWCCHRDLINDVHFDTRQYNHIVWEHPDDLRTKLTNRIGALVGSFVRS
jgi:hypothetical protein